MILLDIDLFKQVNDTYGHEAGNEVLTQLASRLVFFVGDLGVVARYGGEEFAIFMPNFTSSDAHHLATKICNDIRKDRKSTRLNSSHVAISYAVFCLKKKRILMNRSHIL